MKPAQFLLLAFVLAALAKVIHSYRQRRLVPLDFLFWGLVWMGTASVSIFPDAYVLSRTPPGHRPRRACTSHTR